MFTSGASDIEATIPSVIKNVIMKKLSVMELN